MGYVVGYERYTSEYLIGFGWDLIFHEDAVIPQNYFIPQRDHTGTESFLKLQCHLGIFGN
jgi:hypothetical protein